MDPALLYRLYVLYVLYVNFLSVSLDCFLNLLQSGA